MPAQATPKPIPAKRRGWLRRIARWTLWTLLLLVLLHRPLLHFAGRRIVIWLAAREHLILDFHLGGNLWNHLELREVSMHADGQGSTPIVRLKLDHLAVDYHLWKALRSDWTQVLRRADIGVLDGVIALQPPAKDDAPPTPIAKAFAELLSNSLSPVEHLSVGRIDLEVKDVAAIRGFHAEVTRGEPGEIAWEKIHVAGLPDLGAARAEIVTTESSISITKLPLLPQVVVRRLSLNHITPTLPRGGLEFLAEMGGGTASLRVEPSLTPDALDVSVDVDAVRLNEVATPFGVELPVPAAIEKFHAGFTGKPENLETSVADASFVFRMSEKASFPSAVVRGEAKLARGVFRISELSAVSSGVELRIGGELNVPLADFAPSKLNGEITWKLTAPDLASIHLGDLPGLHGAVSGAGRLRIENGEAHTVGDIEATQLLQDRVQADSAVIHLDARRKIVALGDLITGLFANLSFDAKGVTADGVRVDAISVNGKLDGQRVSIEQFSVASGENRITGSARGMLRHDAAGLMGVPEIEVQIAAPRLEQFGVVVNGAALSGAVTAGGMLRLEGTRLTGTLQASGTGLLLGKTPLGGFRAQVKFEDGAAIIESLNVTVADAGEITAQGRVTLAAPLAYAGELHMNLTSLAKLDALLATAGHPAKLGGALKLDWTGDGKIPGMEHSGRLRVRGENLRHDDLVLNEVRLSAIFSPQQFDTEELHVAAGKVKLDGGIQWKDARLGLSKLAVHLGDELIADGEVSVALNPENPFGALPLDQGLSAEISGSNVDIAQLFTGFGMTAPASGKISWDLSATGTLAKPDVKLTVSGRALKSPQAASLAPADLDAKVNITDSRLTLDAVARQRDIQPLTVSASVPFDLEKLRGQPALLRELPLMIAVKMPSTSLAILPRLVPAVARVEGTVAANLAVGGTVAKPVLSGEATLAVRSLRLASPTVPPVSGFKSKITFRDDTVTLGDTRGEIGGGTFNVGGSVNLAKLDQPVLDLRLRSNKVLVLRDESLTVRADADVTAQGPLNSATASGTVFVTQSRFLKDVDIVPLTLPGKPKPQVKSVAAPVRVSFPNPPLRDWKFDIAIKTRDQDSFLIRGNVAKGSTALDLRLGGTGLNPFLTGQVQIESFTALLPVSKLEVKRGTVTFSEDDPFQPQLDVQAESRIGKTTVLMSITGPANAPHLEMESEPPLPQQDIISLLATGTTSGEIGSNTSVLATRTALLTVKRFYKKVFRKNADDSDTGDSLVDRLDVDVGNDDRKTGQPQVEASFRINDKFYLIGEIGLEGQAAGKVRYLMRFR